MEASTSDSSGAGEVPSLWLQSLMPDDYKKKVLERKRLRRKKRRTCLGLSGYSWGMLVFAVLQVVIVAGLQIAIVFLGNFREDRLHDFVRCLDDKTEAILDCATNFSIKISFPSFGRDKEIYVYFFIALTLYNFFLLLYALSFQNVVEIFTFVVINLLAMAYACVQVYQFRGFGSDCSHITPVGYIALANVLILLVFSAVFVVLGLFVYAEFGWKIYKLVQCDAALRYYYRRYQVFMSGVKLVILFTVIFNVIQDILILPPSNYEFPIAIIICVAAILSYPIIYLIARYEFLIGYIGILLCGIALAVQYVYKTVRFITKSCPECRKQVSAVEDELNKVNSAVIKSNCSNNSLVDFEDRSQQFENLVILASVNFIIVVAVLICFIHFWCQRKKGLKQYFATMPLFMLFSSGGRSATNGNVFSFVRKRWSSHNRNPKRSYKRDSSLEEQFDHSEPDWNPIAALRSPSGSMSASGSVKPTAKMPSISEEQPSSTAIN